MKRSFNVAAIAAMGVLAASTALVAASAGSNIAGTKLADGTADGFKVNIPDEVKLEAKGGLWVYDQSVTIQPGGHTGWHTHPGPVLVNVVSGTFRVQEADCSWEDYVPGRTFVDQGGSNVHIGRNPSGEVNTVLSVTYLVPAGAALRGEADAITCP